MHPYLIIAEPSRFQRATRTARTVVVAGGVLAAHLVVGVLVLVLRCARVVITIAATLMAWLELYIAQHTGKPPLGATAGAGIAAAFTAEFATARAHYANAYEGAQQ